MSYLNPFSPHLTEAQKDKVEIMTQEKLGKMFADERERLADLARDCDQKAYLQNPLDERTRDVAREWFYRAARLLTDDTAVLIGEQIKEGIERPHGWVELYFQRPGVRKFMAIAVAGDRFRKFNILVDQAFEDYNRQFSSPSGLPTVDPMGVTAESEWSTGATPDTRCYGIEARTPGIRTSIISQIDFNNYVRKIEVEPKCDLQMNGPGCDYNLSVSSRLSSRGHIVNPVEYVPDPVSTPIPFVRGDVMAFLWICDSCWGTYCEKHEVSGAEIIDPDDVID